MTSAFGVHEKLAELILGRAGLSVVHPLTSEEATRCWHSSRSGTRLRRRVPLSSGERTRRDRARGSRIATDVDSLDRIEP